ncbi:hypothetical protein [Anaeromyxobacter oryzae]|uniref:Uncharacterized protein n=1 Tax=Anaeromyxobacter oryzae TaxID=2918170 RepID=A0ABM7WVC5_9BACT|nr:hypothetical protein [Anaeromyxobacter oryzae]BDG03462.1 hypothetical protein AMOR_24580 [Anaeromyxobacter oryzae]
MLDAAFAPYRLAPGALPEESARAAEALAAEPLLAPPAEPLPAPLVNRALADLPAGRAATASEACRAADGTPSGLSGPPRACLSSERQRARVGELARAALAAGFAGVCLDRPDAPLALGLLGAGFCTDCQRALARHLEREYGDHFQPIDYLALAREAVASASGAVSFDQLPFGRDFWRVRNEMLDRAVRGYARAARDASRAAAKPFEVIAQFEAIGPAQLRAARLVDAAVFPAPVPATATGVGLARLLRAAAGRRPIAIAPAPGAATPAALSRFAAVVATCGIEISGLEPAGEAGAEVASVRRLARQLAQRAGRSPALGNPVAECAILYSAEADLWTGGRHRLAVERAGDALAALHVQAPVVTRLSDAPPEAALVLADAGALSWLEMKEVRRRIEGGAPVLAFGEPAHVDEAGRPAGTFLPNGKPGGVKVGAGLLAVLPPLSPEQGTPAPPDAERLSKALAALLGKGRRAAGVAGRSPLLVVLHRSGDTLDAHLVALGAEKAQGTTLFLGMHVAGGVRRGRFVSADGQDLRIPMNPSGYSISTVLPSFRGYAVLSLQA